MAVSQIFLLCCLLLDAAMIAHVTSAATEDNSWLGVAEELSADALNVRVDFQPYEQTWIKFKEAYGREYGSMLEEAARFQIFVGNVKDIEQHNARFRHGSTTYWMGINQFTDMTVEEFRAYNKLLDPTNAFNDSLSMLKCSVFVPPLTTYTKASSDSVDWRTKGYVTPVKNQGQCGSCWAFSATGTLEGQHFRKTKSLVPLSEQQLVDCAGKFGNRGCQGGWPAKAYAYIYSAGGIDSESVYPYVAKQKVCSFNKGKIAATLKGCKAVKQGSEKDLQASVQTQGPVSVAIQANNNFMKYQGGVYVDNTCSKTLNHGVLVVGYGTSGSQDYWIVKNSWGAKWGSKGYILMARNHGNMCGIATAATFPVV